MNEWLRYGLIFLVPAVAASVVGLVLALGGAKEPGVERGRDRLARVLWGAAFLWAALGAITTVQNVRAVAQMNAQNAGRGLPSGHSSADGRVVLRGTGYELVAVNPDAAIPQGLLERFSDAGHE